MTHEGAEFRRQVTTILTRFLAQNGSGADDTPITGIADRLFALVQERGLPRPLAPEEPGAPGGMAEEVCAPLVARVLGEKREPLLAEAVKQLVKACFYPEFKRCRDSFREVANDGGCRRQERARVLRRISGAHCVDCPHWVALSAETHRVYLRENWRGDPAEFDAHCAVFLPEDFRVFRQWLHATARAK